VMAFHFHVISIERRTHGRKCHTFDSCSRVSISKAVGITSISKHNRSYGVDGQLYSMAISAAAIALHNGECGKPDRSECRVAESCNICQTYYADLSEKVMLQIRLPTSGDSAWTAQKFPSSFLVFLDLEGTSVHRVWAFPNPKVWRALQQCRWAHSLWSSPKIEISCNPCHSVQKCKAEDFAETKCNDRAWFMSQNSMNVQMSTMGLHRQPGNAEKIAKSLIQGSPESKKCKLEPPEFAQRGSKEPGYLSEEVFWTIPITRVTTWYVNQHFPLDRHECPLFTFSEAPEKRWIVAEAKRPTFSKSCRFTNTQ
jgi:hypothetical protein